MYDKRGQWTPRPSELLHLNQAGGAGLDRMVLLKGGRTEKGCKFEWIWESRSEARISQSNDVLYH